MAESDYTLEIPIVADLSRFRAELRQELEQAAKGGVTVPVSTRASAAADAAIERAQSGTVLPRTPRGTSAAMAMTNAGAGTDIFASARNRVANLQAQVSELRALQPSFDPNGWHNVPAAWEPGGSRYVPPATTAHQLLAGPNAPRLPAPALAPNNLQLIAAAAAQHRAQQAGAWAVNRTRAWGRWRGNTAGLPTSSIRGLVGFLGVSEIGNAVQAIRVSERDAELAESSEEAELARAQGVVQSTSGLLGSLISAPLDLVDSEYSPAGRLADAREAVVRRQRRIQANQAGAERFEVRAAIDRELSDQRAGTRALGFRGFARQATENVEAFLSARQELTGEVEAARLRVNALPAGQERTLADLAYRELASRLPERVRAAEERMHAGNTEVARAARRATLTQGRAVVPLQAEAEGRFGEAEEQRFENELEEAQLDAAELGDAFGSRQRGINTLARAGRRTRQLSARKTREAQTEGIWLRMRRLPEAVVELTDIDDQERVALENATDEGDRESIRGNFFARRAAVAQQFQDQRFDLNAGLDAGLRQTAFRIRGGAGGRLDAQLDQIVESSRSESRALERAGLEDEAAKRRRLGSDQVAAFRADFYRSVQFEEVSGSRIVGGQGGPFDDVERKFRDADKRAGQRGEGGTSETMTGEQGQQMIDLLRQILERHFRARAG